MRKHKEVAKLLRPASRKRLRGIIREASKLSKKGVIHLTVSRRLEPKKGKKL